MRWRDGYLHGISLGDGVGVEVDAVWKDRRRWAGGWTGGSG